MLALAAGSFIVAMTDPSCEFARIVDEEEVGVVTPPDDSRPGETDCPLHRIAGRDC